MKMRFLTIAVLAALALPGCTAPAPPAPHRNMEVLVDSSDSGGLTSASRAVAVRLGEWADSAPPGSVAEVWVLAPKDSPVEVELKWDIEVPEPRPPVDDNRMLFKKRLAEELAQELAEVKRVEWSPILEGLYRIQRRGATLPGDYELLIYSDHLLQTSPLGSFTPQFLAHCDAEEVAAGIAAELPRAERAPLGVTILYRPGNTQGGGRVAGAAEERLEKLFRRVLEDEWGLPPVSFRNEL